MTDCWIRAKRKPSGAEQHVVNVSVGDEYREQTFVIEPKDVLDGDLLIAQLNFVRNTIRLWRRHGDAEEALRVIEKAIGE